MNNTKKDRARGSVLREIRPQLVILASKVYKQKKYPKISKFSVIGVGNGQFWGKPATKQTTNDFEAARDR